MKEQRRGTVRQTMQRQQIASRAISHAEKAQREGEDVGAGRETPAQDAENRLKAGEAQFAAGIENVAQSAAMAMRKQALRKKAVEKEVKADRENVSEQAAGSEPEIFTETMSAQDHFPIPEPELPAQISMFEPEPLERSVSTPLPEQKTVPVTIGSEQHNTYQAQLPPATVPRTRAETAQPNTEIVPPERTTPRNDDMRRRQFVKEAVRRKAAGRGSETAPTEVPEESVTEPPKEMKMGVPQQAVTALVPSQETVPIPARQEAYSTVPAKSITQNLKTGMTETENVASIQTVNMRRRQFIQEAARRKMAGRGNAVYDTAGYSLENETQTAHPTGTINAPKVTGEDIAAHDMAYPTGGKTARPNTVSESVAPKALLKGLPAEKGTSGTLGTSPRAATSAAQKGENVKRSLYVRAAARQKTRPKGHALLPIVRKGFTLPQTRTRTAGAHLRSGLRRMGEKLRAALGKMLRRAARSSLGVICAACVIVLLFVSIGAVASVIGSPMGILFSDQTGDPAAASVSDVVRSIHASFVQAINDLVDAHPEADTATIEYVYANGGTWTSYWPEVLAVFAVQTSTANGEDVIIIDDAKAQMLRDVFFEMNVVSSEVETVSQEAGAEGAEEADAAAQDTTVLRIKVTGKTADDMADAYSFSPTQCEVLQQMLGAEIRPMLVALCGNITPVNGVGVTPTLTGDLLWPLPGIYNITCHFGEPDAIRGLPHRGMDIAAPEGTPILAAHSGTVAFSGWGNSYGNNVLLDDGAGVSTRYAHMIQTAVSAGEAVTPGQVIGYVGNTGDSMGNHLHFELKIGGTLTDPESAVTG